MIRLLFPAEVYDAAREYFLMINGSVWQGCPTARTPEICWNSHG
jgi:hypothetical protein